VLLGERVHTRAGGEVVDHAPWRGVAASIPG
jgi:hypothetical protein